MSRSTIKVIAVSFLATVACGTEPTAPPASKPLAVSIQYRMREQGEAVPSVHASSAAGALTIRVSRTALCATQVRAAIRRGVGTVDVVSHVSPDPAALCTASEADRVVDYTGTVSALPPGNYRVRVLEGVGDGAPRYIGAQLVTVSRSP